MPRYRLKRTEFDAFKYNGELLAELPEWARNYRAYTPMNGMAGIGWLNGAELLIPHAGGVAQCFCGQTMLWDGKTITVATARQLEELYDEIEPVPAA